MCLQSQQWERTSTEDSLKEPRRQKRLERLPYPPKLAELITFDERAFCLAARGFSCLRANSSPQVMLQLLGCLPENRHLLVLHFY